MNINIEDYLSNEEIKEIVKESVKTQVRTLLGNSQTSFVNLFVKRLAKEEVQKLIPNFKDLINEQIESEIKKITLPDFFFTSFGWRSEGNKVLNGVLQDNKALLDAKIKEIFKPLL
jgi:uncharacterized protein (DUF2164 family)